MERGLPVHLPAKTLIRTNRSAAIAIAIPVSSKASIIGALTESIDRRWHRARVVFPGFAVAGQK